MKKPRQKKPKTLYILAEKSSKPIKKKSTIKKVTVKPKTSFNAKAAIIGSALATAGLTLYGVKKYLDYIKRNQINTPFPDRLLNRLQHRNDRMDVDNVNMMNGFKNLK